MRKMLHVEHSLFTMDRRSHDPVSQSRCAVRGFRNRIHHRHPTIPRAGREPRHPRGFDDRLSFRRRQLDLVRGALPAARSVLAGLLAGSLWGARGYNLFHSYIGPALLGVLAWLLGSQSLALLALIWVAHIGLDRVLGFGLKYGTGFGDTHLGRIGRRKALSWPCG